jgi:SPP1 family predicted phage head-tail adaptor
VNPRKLTHTITILKEKQTRDGAGQQVSSFAPWLQGVPAAYAETAGGKSPRGLQVEATVTAVFTTRYLEGVSNKNQIQYDGRIYSVKAALDLDGDKQWLELHCSDVR